MPCFGRERHALLATPSLYCMVKAPSTTPSEFLDYLALGFRVRSVVRAFPWPTGLKLRRVGGNRRAAPAAWLGWLVAWPILGCR